MSAANRQLPKLRILITGAGSGFGLGAAKTLAGRGHQIIAGVENSAQAAALHLGLVRDYPETEVLQLDLTQVAQIESAAQLEVDVLVNNAGFGAQGPISESPESLVRKVFEINLFGPFALTRQVVAKMRQENRTGRIVFVSSVAGLMVNPGAGAYSMSKHALDAMAIEFQQELASSPISVHILNPGPYQTGFNEKLVQNAPQDGSRAASQNAGLLDAQKDPAEAISILADLADGRSKQPRVITPPEFIRVINEIRRGQLEPGGWAGRAVE